MKHWTRIAVLSTALSVIAVGAAVTPAWAAAPNVATISPTTAPNGASTQPTTITFIGTSMDTVTAATLHKAGHSDIVGTAVGHTDALNAFADFDLTGAATGTWDVRVTNPDGTGVCSACLIVTAPLPTVSGAVPNAAGQGVSGVVVEVDGTNFAPDATVTFSNPGITVTHTSFVDATKIDVTINVSGSAPTGSPGSTTITVMNGDGGTSTPCGCFQVNPKPTVSASSPSSAPNTGPTTLTFSGLNFETGGTATLTKTGQSTITGTNWHQNTSSSLSVDFDITDAAPGAWVVNITNIDGGSGSCTNCFTISAGAPDVTSTSPSSRPQGTTTNVHVLGSNLYPGATISFSGSGVAVNSTTWNDSGDITANITVDPAAAVGARNVMLTNTDGQSSTCNGCFTVTKPLPVITNVTPSTGHQGATMNVFVTGGNYQSGAAVTFSPATGITVNSTTFTDAGHLTANITISNSAPATARDVIVTNPDTNSATCSSCFTVQLPAPTVTSASPNAATRGATKDITINGTGFVSGAAASFSGTGITVHSTTFVDATHVTANITIDPAATLGARDVTVTNPDTQSGMCTSCFTVQAPVSVTITAPTSLTGPIIATFGRDVGGVTTSNFVFGVTGSGTTLAGTVACKNSSSAATSCAGTTVRSAWLTPTARLVPGQHYTASVNPPGAPTSIADSSGVAAATTSQAFRGSLSEEESSLAASYLWRAVSNSHAIGGTYTTERLAGASASYTFTGTSLRWYTILGPNQGTAHVYIDGASFGQVNNYRSTAVLGAYWTFSSLSAGTHTLRIVVDGLKGSSSGTGTYISVDAMKPGTDAIQSNPSVTYKWRVASFATASGGHYAASDQPGASVFFSFRGTRVDWYTVFGKYDGQASIYIDGALKGTVDTYRSSTITGKITFLGLSDTTHVIRIIVKGTKSAASGGTNIIIDRFVVF